jgi:hypothetical protein
MNKENRLSGDVSPDEVMTLTLKQLLKYFPEFSSDNILEIANQGYFGVCIKPKSSRKTYEDIGKHIERCKDEILNKEFDCFVKNFPHLLEKKPGYERLATKIEVNLYRLCSNFSIQKLIENEKIYFEEYSWSRFGLVKFEDRYVSNCYRLFYATNLVRCIPPPDYKGYFDKEDIIFFATEIEKFKTTNPNFNINKHRSKIGNRKLKDTIFVKYIDTLLCEFKQGGIELNDGKLPAIKDMLIASLQRTSKHFATLSPTTIKDYFKRNRIKFLPGRPPAKNKIPENIIEAISRTERKLTPTTPTYTVS